MRRVNRKRVRKRKRRSRSYVLRAEYLTDPKRLGRYLVRGLAVKARRSKSHRSN